MAKLKRDDEVIVIAGKDKGKRGTVRRIIDSDRVVVSGVIVGGAEREEQECDGDQSYGEECVQKKPVAEAACQAPIGQDERTVQANRLDEIRPIRKV